MTADPRQRAERQGRLAELAAAAWLTAKGYRVLAWRWACPTGELDLVARRGRLLAFVEVKARRTRAAAAAAITPHVRRRIEAAAAWFRATRPDLARLDCRFDAVLVSRGRLPYHARGAWRPDAIG